MHIFEQEVWFDNRWSKITYIQGNPDQEISGYYICVVYGNDCVHGLIQYTEPLIGMLRVTATFVISISNIWVRTDTNVDHISNNPTLAYDNYCKDIQILDHYKCTYEEHMTHVIDELILAADLDLDNEFNQHSQELICFQRDIPSIIDSNGNNFACEYNNRELKNKMVKNLATDFNYPDKKFGYLTQAATDFSFVGPDRKPVDISSIDTLLKVADCILNIGVPNYQAARIPIKLAFNVEAWEKHLQRLFG